ncbi:uncharacterized protein LOC124942994 [Impatiens glandulifera]|uniref:uncharacterized protein LOC124942994 n=1 Tax=Impatiens glandulifera TaxID=253017 RepID=UPI001FB0FACC|nr:uncharacterized protein LOC124942994 [Impatiens glandulifera]
MTYKPETREHLCDVLIVKPLNEGSPIVDIDLVTMQPHVNDDKMVVSHEVMEGDDVGVEGQTTRSYTIHNMEPLNEHNPVVDPNVVLILPHEVDLKKKAIQEMAEEQSLNTEGGQSVGSSVLDSSSTLEENQVELPSQKRSFSCDYCNLSFSNFHALAGHQNAHRRERELIKKRKLSEMGRYNWSPPLAYPQYPYTHHHSPMFSSASNRSSPLRLRYTNRPSSSGLQMGPYTNGPPFNGSNNRYGSTFGSFSRTGSPIMPHNYVLPQPLYSGRFRSFGQFHANINIGGTGTGSGSGSGGGNNINVAPPFRFPGSSSNNGGGVSSYLSKPLDAGFLKLGNGPVEGDGGGELDLDLKL